MQTDPEKRSPLAATHAIERLRAEQFAHIIRHSPGIMLANMCNAAVFAAASWDRPYRDAALVWAALLVAIASFPNLRRKLRRRRAATAPPLSSRRLARAVAFSAILGACWGALPLLFLEGASVGGKLLIACLCSGMLGGGAFVMASLPPAAIAFCGPIALGSYLALLRAGDKDYLLTTIVLAVYSAVLLKVVYNYAENIEQRITTQIEAEANASKRLERLHASGLQALGGMASGMAHEIVQPLAAASAYVAASRRLLHQTPHDATLIERNLRSASEQIGHAGEIIARLRQFLLEGKPALAPVGLHGLIDEACRASASALERAQASLELRLEAANDVVQADRVQIIQVLSNLLRNAADALEEAPERRVTIACRNENGSVRIDVVDSGAGVAEGVKERLFEPFMTTKPGGMGVGLAMCRTIVEAHGGRIWLEPNSAGGATFSLVLPADEDRSV